ncbi:MAG: hypothetical protein ABSC49_03300 [Candidatus Microgenomates bacterium]|jgi:hypothetical protein
MKTKRLFIVLFVLILGIIVGCAPSAAQIQEAIAETQTAAPTITPTNTLQPTSTPVPTTVPTKADIPNECLTFEAVQYVHDWGVLDDRFSTIYAQSNNTTSGLSTYEVDMQQLIQDTKALQPPELFKAMNSVFLSEEEAYQNFLNAEENGDTKTANQMIQEQEMYNGLGQAEWNKINTYCNGFKQTTVGGSNT